MSQSEVNEVGDGTSKEFETFWSSLIPSFNFTLNLNLISNRAEERHEEICVDESPGGVDSKVNDQVMSPPEKDIKCHPNFKVIEGIAEGGYSSVVKVKHMKDDQLYAMKVISKSIIPSYKAPLNVSSPCSVNTVVSRTDVVVDTESASESESESDGFQNQIHLNMNQQKEKKAILLNELNIMISIKPSIFIQKCHYAYETGQNIYFILDLYVGGDFHHHLSKRLKTTMYEDSECFSEKECRIILAELYLAIEHLHSNGYIHCDIKVENVMLDHEGHVKLIDFGLSVEFDENDNENVLNNLNLYGSLIYMAPELIKYKTGGRHTDWWAYGIIAYELVTGNSPWSCITDNIKLIKKEILCKKIPLPLPFVISVEFSNFIMILLNRNYKKRLGTRKDVEIKNHLFFKESKTAGCSIDWLKTARLETPPAFLPVNEKEVIEESEKELSLAKYLKMTQEESDFIDILV